MILVATALMLAAATPPAMAYCTPDDVEEAYTTQTIAELTGDAQGQSVDTEKVQRAIDTYGAHMEMHLRMQHPDNPFDIDNQYLNALNVEGAYIELQKKTPGGLDEQLQRAEKRLDDILMRIAAGQMQILDPDQETDAEDGALLDPDDLVDAPDRHFTWNRKLPLDT